MLDKAQEIKISVRKYIFFTFGVKARFWSKLCIMSLFSQYYKIKKTLLLLFKECFSIETSRTDYINTNIIFYCTTKAN